MISIKKSKKEKILEKSIQIGLDSTSHGIPKIIKSEKTCLKIMWLVLFLLSSSLGIYLIIQSFINYFYFDVVTSIKVFKETPTEFPAITFYILRNKKVNISLNYLIHICEFNNFECNISKDIRINKDKFGFISYTFKSQLTYFGGSYYSLRIGVNLANISFDKTNTLDGLRIIIHNKTSDPNYYLGISQNGFNLASGFNYEISVNRIFSYKLGLPYNNCLKDVKSIDSFDSVLYRYIIQSTNYSYKQTDCLNYCAGRELYNYLNMTNKIERWENIIAKYPQHFITMKMVYLDMLKKGIYETCFDCPEECDSIQYDISHSFAKILTQNELFNNVQIENYVFFNVYYENLQYTVIDQIAQMNVFDLISNIGGNLGLFIGISFLSFAELIELLVEILCIIFSKKGNQTVKILDTK
jgi:hypothetical protein